MTVQDVAGTRAALYFSPKSRDRVYQRTRRPAEDAGPEAMPGARARRLLPKCGDANPSPGARRPRPRHVSPEADAPRGIWAWPRNVPWDVFHLLHFLNHTDGSNTMYHLSGPNKTHPGKSVHGDRHPEKDQTMATEEPPECYPPPAHAPLRDARPWFHK